MAMFFVGSGGVLGSGFGIHQYYVSSLKSSVTDTSSESLDPREAKLDVESQTTEGAIDVSVNDSGEAHDLSTRVTDLDGDRDTEDPDEEEVSETISGNLVLIKEESTDGWSDYSYRLKVEREGEEGDSSGEFSVSFESSEPEKKINDLVRDFNWSVEVNPGNISYLLDTLREKQTKFSSIFGSLAYSNLLTGIESLSN
ncbi:hypothetical protein MHLP_01970 [Candidatus Mycoplasma haematolamae str. Purdue]|uniref:Uncharacterized protein n=1 Tax=Mycoplasma haematolamae (strain Purdue) TaxID=1212765 RepID=I7CJF6_MYCHA|nr:hypothetical protein MHLP_01970 [Candidatus Mycoplasma haematolamae str. Purdue]